MWAFSARDVGLHAHVEMYDFACSKLELELEVCKLASYIPIARSTKVYLR